MFVTENQLVMNIKSILISLFSLSLIIHQTKAQNSSMNERFISWEIGSNWTSGTTPNSNQGGQNIIIDGAVLRSSSFVLGTHNALSGTSYPSDMTVKTGDSLVILGNLTINPDSKLTVEDGGYLYVDGNLNNNGEFILFFFATGDGGEASNDGVIAVTGNYNQGPGATIDNSMGDFYVEGSSGSTPNKGPIPADIQNIYDVLPIELKAFDVTFNGHDVQLDWITAKEENFSHFEIERSNNSTEFELIGIVQGNGESLSDISYDWVDYNAPFGTVYYRLKSVDLDGAFDYSPIKKVEKQLQGQVKALPNPTNSLKNIKIQLPGEIGDHLDQLSLFDLNGTLLYQKKNIDLYNEDLRLPDVRAGIYIFTIQVNGVSENIRVVIR